jgi:hypothetical protein
VNVRSAASGSTPETTMPSAVEVGPESLMYEPGLVCWRWWYRGTGNILARERMNINSAP